MAYDNYTPRRRRRPEQDYPQHHERDPRDLAEELFSDDGTVHVMQTAGIRRAEEEPYADLVSSAGWNEVTKRMLIPLIHSIKKELLSTIDLDEGQRKGDIRVLGVLGLLLTQIYKRADEQMPDYIRREIQ